ncbi:MAG: putative metal-binding motif-containing protein [Deltaproteobacteria bacterium]|nr:putative metal-binding motif-containing protein [Deltaproteobacteria bacterium]
MHRIINRNLFLIKLILGLATISLGLGACGGKAEKAASLSAPPAPITEADGWPTAPDSNEGATGNNDIATATPVAVGSSALNTVFPVGDLDFFAFNLEAGVTYEISANDLCPTCDSTMALYDSVGTDITMDAGYNDDDYIYYDSRLLYTPTVSGTYYVRVSGYPDETSTYQISYTLSSREFTDADGDTYSPYYDCDETDPFIYPWGSDNSPDGIDQDCDGVDLIYYADNLLYPEDAFEPDNEMSTAKTLLPVSGLAREIQLRNDYFQTTQRTQTTDGVTSDIDWFKVTIPPHAKYTLRYLTFTGATRFSIYDSLGTLIYANFLGTYPIQNLTDLPETYYISVAPLTPGTGGMIVPYIEDNGTDADGDFSYTKDWDWFDCNDSDPTIYSGNTETIDDGIDSNCNGLDNT